MEATSQSQEGKQPKQLPQILKVGSNSIEEIETRCLTTPKEFVIQMQTQPKIKDRFNESNFKDLLGLTFVKTSLLAGIKNPMDDFIKTDLKNLIFLAFKQLTIDEIYKAFEMERFDLYEQRTECFQLFDTIYVSEILKKYLKWKQDFKDKHKITIERPPAIPKYTETEKIEILNKGIIRQFEH